MTNRLVARVNQLRFSGLDFKVGFRMLARYPGLTVVGTLAIAVAIALGSLYFEALNKWQNPRLPVQDAERVVSIRNWDLDAVSTEGRSLNDFAIWRAQVKTIENMGAAIPFVRNLGTENTKGPRIHCDMMRREQQCGRVVSNLQQTETHRRFGVCRDCCNLTSVNPCAPECRLLGVPILAEDAGLLCVHFRPTSEHRDGGHRE